MKFHGVKCTFVTEKPKGQSVYLYLEMENLASGSGIVTD